jgi:hypothetical protein
MQVGIQLGSKCQSPLFSIAKEFHFFKLPSINNIMCAVQGYGVEEISVLENKTNCFQSKFECSAVTLQF